MTICIHVLVLSCHSVLCKTKLNLPDKMLVSHMWNEWKHYNTCYEIHFIGTIQYTHVDWVENFRKRTVTQIMKSRTSVKLKSNVLIRRVAVSIFAGKLCGIAIRVAAGLSCGINNINSEAFRVVFSQSPGAAVKRSLSKLFLWEFRETVLHHIMSEGFFLVSRTIVFSFWRM